MARILLGPPLTYYTVVNKDSHVLVKAGALGILVVSLLWFHKIISMVTRAKQGGKKEPAAAEKKPARPSARKSEKAA